MGGGHENQGLGFHPPHVKPIHRRLAQGVGAIAWFWLMYRFREDGAVMFGLRDQPWVADVKREEAELKRAQEAGKQSASKHH